MIVRNDTTNSNQIVKRSWLVGVVWTLDSHDISMFGFWQDSNERSSRAGNQFHSFVVEEAKVQTSNSNWRHFTFTHTTGFFSILSKRWLLQVAETIIGSRWSVLQKFLYSDKNINGPFWKLNIILDNFDSWILINTEILTYWN